MRHTLFGTGGAQGLDGHANAHHKRMLLSVATGPNIARLDAPFAERWRGAVARRPARVDLTALAYDLLFRAACVWAGVPDRDATDAAREDVVSLIESAGAAGPRHWRGRIGRRRANARAAALIARQRAGEIDAPPGTALHAVAAHTPHPDPAGRPLDRHTAAVTLLNLIRPVAAVARYVVFAALALHAHPGCRARLAGEVAGGDPDPLAAPTYADAFAHEVRRFPPVLPERDRACPRLVRLARPRVPGRAADGARFVRHLPRPAAVRRPRPLRPERFLGGRIDPFALVPQGGGGHWAGHRCAGEWVTLMLIRRAACLLAAETSYDVPRQDLRVEMRRLPPGPRDGFVMADVRPTGA